MSWLDKMNEVVAYIEANLDKEIDMNVIAEISCYSATTFQRMFSILCDTPLSEYIRRRRLTLAAFELLHSKSKIVDLAAKYGYESPEAFTRAFHALHGVSPSEARRAGTSLTAYPRISFHLSVKGDAPMNYRIEQKNGFDVYGIERIISTANGSNWQEVPAFWNDMIQSGELQKLVESANVPDSAIGLNTVNAIDCYRTTGNDTFPYMLFAFKTSSSNTDGYQVISVPPATWAIFTSEPHSMEGTSSALTGLIRQIYADWLPSASYKKQELYEFEMTYKQDGKFYSEIWIRVEPQIQDTL